MPLTSTIELLKGKKTYLVAFAAGLIVALHIAGALSDTAEDEILKALGASGAATIAAKMNRLRNGE